MPPAVPKSFQKPVRASQARSEAQQIIDRNREAVERSTGKARDEFVRMLLDAQRKLELQLADIRARRGQDTWTAYDVEATLVQVRAALGAMGPKFVRLLEENARRAAAVGAKNTAELLAHFEKKAGGGKGAGGVLRPLALREASSMNPALLSAYPTSVDRYGVHMIGVIRQELQAGILRGATFDEMTDLLVGRRGPRGLVSMSATVTPTGRVVRLRQERIQEGLFVRHRYWAERIVRTEGMRAMNAAAHQECIEQRREIPDIKKKCVETFDRRTAKDSYYAHGQVRELQELFADGKGRQYLYPPGRPNDRGVTIPWRDAWGPAKRRSAPVAVVPPPVSPPPTPVAPPASPPPPQAVQAPPPAALPIAPALPAPAVAAHARVKAFAKAVGSALARGDGGAVRDGVREALQAVDPAMVSRDVALGRRDAGKLAIATPTGARAYHDLRGLVCIRGSIVHGAADALRILDASATGARALAATSATAIQDLRTFFHEEAHGFSPFTSASAHQLGALGLEEALTETLARKAVRQLYGNPTKLAPGSSIAPPSHDGTKWHGNGTAYPRYLARLCELTEAAGVPRAQVVGVLEDAAQGFRHTGQGTTTPAEHAERFVANLPISPSARTALAKTIVQDPGLQ